MVWLEGFCKKLAYLYNYLINKDLYMIKKVQGRKKCSFPDSVRTQLDKQAAMLVNIAIFR